MPHRTQVLRVFSIPVHLLLALSLGGCGGGGSTDGSPVGPTPTATPTSTSIVFVGSVVGSGTFKSGNEGRYLCQHPVTYGGSMKVTLNAPSDGAVTGTLAVDATQTFGPGTPVSGNPSCNTFEPLPGGNVPTVQSFVDSQPVTGTASSLRATVSTRVLGILNMVTTGTFEGAWQGNAITGTLTLYGTLLPAHYWDHTGTVAVALTRQ